MTFTAEILVYVGVGAFIALLIFLQLTKDKNGNPRLDLADGLKDEAYRTSCGRICAVGGFIVSAYVLALVGWAVIQPHPDPALVAIFPMVFIGFTLLWAMVMLGSKGLDVIRNIWGKP